MANCKVCGKNIKRTRQYCDAYCMRAYRLSCGGGRKCVIGKLCRSGAKELAIHMIKLALQDKDFRWIYSSRSYLYFALADLSREQVMDGYDDNLNPLYVKAARRGAKSKAVELPPEFEGMTMGEIAEMYDMQERCLSDRLHRGMSWKEALTAPLRR